MRRVLLICVLALAFASPAFGADIYVSNNSSLPQEQLADALPTFQQALDEDFAPTWREASGSRLILGKAPQRAWQIRIANEIPECCICAGCCSPRCPHRNRLLPGHVPGVETVVRCYTRGREYEMVCTRRFSC